MQGYIDREIMNMILVGVKLSINISVAKRPCEGSWTCQHETHSEPEIEFFNIIDPNRDTLSYLF